MQSLDPRTNESKLEVQRIIHLQSLANEQSDAFTNHKRVTRSHIPAVKCAGESTGTLEGYQLYCLPKS
jgi:hypothetical protein